MTSPKTVNDDRLAVHYNGVDLTLTQRKLSVDVYNVTNANTVFNVRTDSNTTPIRVNGDRNNPQVDWARPVHHFAGDLPLSGTAVAIAPASERANPRLCWIHAGSFRKSVWDAVDCRTRTPDFRIRNPRNRRV